MKDARPVVVLDSTGPRDTVHLGQVLGGLLRPGDVVSLVGPLGAGKTVLAQGIAQGMGVRDRVTSPTYVLARRHPASCGAVAGCVLYHLDAYRLADEAEACEAGLDELMQSPGAVCVVEWADRIPGLLSCDAGVEISIQWAGDRNGSENGRVLVIEGRGARGEGLVRELERNLEEGSRHPRRSGRPCDP